MYKAFKYRIYPTEPQKELIAKHIGSNCSSVLDRDVNAAINIKSFALKNIFSGTESKNQDELLTLVKVLTPEAQPIASGVGG